MSKTAARHINLRVPEEIMVEIEGFMKRDGKTQTEVILAALDRGLMIPPIPDGFPRGYAEMKMKIHGEDRVLYYRMEHRRLKKREKFLTALLDQALLHCGNDGALVAQIQEAIAAKTGGE